MTHPQPSIVFSLCLIASGLCLAGFWILTYPFDGFAGADVVTHHLFVPGQVLHLVGALMAVFGYFAIYQATQKQAGPLAIVAVIIGVTGTSLFAADAVIALFVFPVLAKTSPDLIEPTGAMFSGAVLTFYTATYVTHMVGILLLAASLAWARAAPVTVIIAFGLGGILMNLPPMPGLHVVAIMGGSLFGLNAMAIGGSILRQRAQIKDHPEQSP